MADPMVCRALRIFGRLDATSTPRLEWQRAIAYSQVGDADGALESARKSGMVGMEAVDKPLHLTVSVP